MHAGKERLASYTSYISCYGYMINKQESCRKIDLSLSTDKKAQGVYTLFSEVDY